MKTLLLAVIALMAIGIKGNAQDLNGKKIFTDNCMVCHTIGSGDIVGPDLAGVTERREVDWIKSFIRNSQKMVAEGNEQAVEVFNAYNKVPMPSHNFSDEEMDQLISYMEEASEGGSTAQVQEEEQIQVPSDPSEVSAEEDSVSVVQTSGLNGYIIALLAILGVTAIALIITAGYLYGILKR